MKKLLILSICILMIVVTSCAMGKNGETYLAYSWTGRPLSWQDDNPSIPNIIYNGTYYATKEGRFYMEYTAWDSSSWWMYYTISSNPGQIFNDGAPAYFEISLYSFGPSLYKWSTARDLKKSSRTLSLPEDDNTPIVTKDLQGTEKKILANRGFETMTVEGVTIELEFGLLE